MKNLLKSDFYRARKDKVLWIGLIVTVALVLMQVLLVKAVLSASDVEQDAETVGNMLGTSGMAMWMNGISIMGNTTQYIIPIFLTIFFVKEFSDRTIRNKLIIGYSRSQIFFSIIIVHAVLSVIFYLAASLVGLALGGALFGFGTTFNGGSFAMLIVGFLLEFLLSYVLIGFAIIFAINKQSMTLGIVIPIVVAIVFSILGTLGMFVSQNFTKFLSFFNFYQASEIQGMTDISELTVRTIVKAGDETTYYLPLTPLARILIINPIVVVAELLIGYRFFRKIQFK